eukprot:2827606-Amphidinium_carterae.1
MNVSRPRWAAGHSEVQNQRNDDYPPLAPYADFAIFGPYGTRITRKLRFSALIYSASGDLQHAEITGPDGFAAWSRCYS